MLYLILNLLKSEIIAQGIITVPEPKIGNASTKPINKAINNGNSMLKFANFNIDNPIKEIIKDTKISVASAFKYPPNVFVKSFMWCCPIFKNPIFVENAALFGLKYITLSTHIKYKAIIVTTKYIIIDGIDVIIFNKPVKKFLTHPEAEVSTSPVEFWIIDC